MDYLSGGYEISLDEVSTHFESCVKCSCLIIFCNYFALNINKIDTFFQKSAKK